MRTRHAHLRAIAHRTASAFPARAAGPVMHARLASHAFRLTVLTRRHHRASSLLAITQPTIPPCLTSDQPAHHALTEPCWWGATLVSRRFLVRGKGRGKVPDARIECPHRTITTMASHRTNTLLLSRRSPNADEGFSNWTGIHSCERRACRLLEKRRPLRGL